MNRVAGITSNTVPWEILRAAGLSPRLLESEAGPTPYADRFMEDVFERRMRVIFDRLCAGAWSDIEVVILPRTSEQEHKLYLYLREATRVHTTQPMPRLYLYDILHTRSPESYAYGLDRTRQMVEDFSVSESALREAVLESNRARSAVRRVLNLRREGRLEGSIAIKLIAGFYSKDRHSFGRELEQRLPGLGSEGLSKRPRILIKGAPLNHLLLHELVESCGGYVVAEDDWRGARAAGDFDIREDGDPVTAIFEKYFYDEASPRVHPPELADSWFRRETEDGRVDGVLFYIPLEDDVVGWDYPRHASFLKSRNVANLVVRESGAPEPTTALTERVREFVDSLKGV